MLKCNPVRWLWGLLPLVPLWWVGGMDMQRRIEADLAQRANEHLARNNLAWASVGFTGRDALLTGRAEEESDQRRPAIELAKVWGVRSLEDRIEVLQFVKDYVWRASTKDGVLVLNGFVPNEAARKAILASARTAFPKYKVEDQMDLARGAPEQKVWLGGTAFALRQLAALKTGGRAALEVSGLVLDGEADSSKGYETIRSELSRSMPQGISLKTDRVIPPVVKPFTWAASLRGRQIELSGHAPSVQARDQIKAAAAAAVSGATLTDRMTIASGAPPDWQKVAALALAELGKLKQGNAELTDNQFSIAGLTETEPAADAVRADLKKGVPSSFRLTENIRQDPVVKAAEEARKAAEEAARRAAEEAEAKRRAAAEAEAQRRAEAQRLESEAQMKARLAEEEAARRRAEEEAQRRSADAKRTAEEAARKSAADADAKRARDEQERQARAKAEEEAKAKARVVEAQRCQRDLTGAVEKGTITFKRASADLDVQSHKTLDALAQILRGCPSYAVEVAGHTDNEGLPERKQRLSERRAQSVLNYLVKAGVPSSTLSAVGYGDSKPRVPNDTVENMAINRRIELSVKQK